MMGKSEGCFLFLYEIGHNSQEICYNAYKNFRFLHLDRNRTNTPERALKVVSNIKLEKSTSDIEQQKLKRKSALEKYLEIYLLVEKPNCCLIAEKISLLITV